MAAWAIGVDCWVAAICVWHLAHSAVPTKFLSEDADLVGHQAGDESMRSSVEREMAAFVFAVLIVGEVRACARACATS